MGDESKAAKASDDLYEAVEWATPLGESDYSWVVRGPGLGGLAGTIPKHNQQMSKQSAEELAALLNLLGRKDAQRDLRSALGLRDWAGEVKVA